MTMQTGAPGDGDDGKGKITGRHVAIGFVAFFGTVITVNLFMAYNAVGTFPGLVSKNTFMASQSFDDRVAAQQALGWDVAARMEEGGVLAIAFTDAAGGPAEVARLDAVVGRPAHMRADFTPEFTHLQGTFRTPVDLDPGMWSVRLVAHAPDGTPFEARLALDID